MFLIDFMEKIPLKERVSQIINLLKKIYGNPKTALHYGDPFQLLVSVILSAQCTDERVNKVTPILFDKYPDINSFSVADIEDIKKIIFSTGFYNNKAKNILLASQKIISDFDGKLPNSIEKLIQIPGVARKTANVVMGELYGKTEGIVVDTHVIRLSGRLGLVDEKWVRTKNAVKIENQLMAIVPKDKWDIFPNLLILHGRSICKARKPDCNNCVLKEICPFSKI